MLVKMMMIMPCQQGTQGGKDLLLRLLAQAVCAASCPALARAAP